MRKITICDKEYKIESNGYTRFLYKQVFNRKILADIGIISEFYEDIEKYSNKLKKDGISEQELNAKVGNYMLTNIDDVLDIIFMLAYIFILTANSDFKSYEDWLKELKNINVNDAWIGEVTEIAVDSFHGSGTIGGIEKNTSKTKSKRK